jgi:uncharacterized protein YgbK (DUF1537 family)
VTRLVILADDLTGSLDTGVQFASKGADVRVVTNPEHLFDRKDLPAVIVIDTESRHIASDKAYEIVKNLAKGAMDAGVEYIFKKTDSALRGNIGSELTALLDAGKSDFLPFLPAFPQMNRVTKGGVQYIDDMPLAESIFNQDPYEPTKESSITKIIASQSRITTQVVEHHQSAVDLGVPNIAIYDVLAEEELQTIANRLHQQGKLAIMAGCAGFASVLPELLGLTGAKQQGIHPSQGILTICGSVNPVTIKQLDYGEDNGFTRLRLTPQQKLQRGYWNSPRGAVELSDLTQRCISSKRCIIDTNDPIGRNDTALYVRENGIPAAELQRRIPDSLGVLVRNIVNQGMQSTLVVMGGDTLTGILRKLGITELEPVTELFPGTVLSSFVRDGKQYQIVTKSGGFGSESLLMRLADRLLNEEDRNADKIHFANA